RLTYLPDGETRLNPTAFFPASTEDAWKLHPEWLDGDGQLLCSLGGLLVETGDRRVLIDTGFGPRHAEFPGFGPFDGGRLLQSLSEHGHEPGEIDTVVFTHLHLDHVNASVRRDGDGWALAFPRAKFLVRETEWHHWVGKNDPTGMYEETETAIRDRVDLCDADAAVARSPPAATSPTSPSAAACAARDGGCGASTGRWRGRADRPGAGAAGHRGRPRPRHLRPGDAPRRLRAAARARGGELGRGARG